MHMVQQKQLLVITASAKARQLIDALKQADPKEAREGLAQLLYFPNEWIQKESLDGLESFLGPTTLVYDIENLQTQALVALEKQLSDRIYLCVREGEAPTFCYGLLALYDDLIEHLWLIPHLAEDAGASIRVIEQHASKIIQRAEAWLKLCEAPFLKQMDVGFDCLGSIKRGLLRIRSDLPEAVKETLANIKQPIHALLFPTELRAMYRAWGDYQNVVFRCQRDLEFYSQFKGVPDLGSVKAEIYSELGEAYCVLQEFDEALGCYQQAIGLHHADPQDPTIVLSAQLKVGNMCYSQGHLSQALHYHQQALQRAQEISAPEMESCAHSSLGLVLAKLKRFPEALEHHQKDLAIALKLKDTNGERITYNHMGLLYMELGEYDRAIDCHLKALKIAQQSTSKKGEDLSLEYLGDTYYRQNKWEEALAWYHKAWDIAKTRPNWSQRGRLQFSMGKVQQGLGQHRQALQHFTGALRLAHGLNDPSLEGKAHLGLFNTYLILGDVDQLHQHLKRLEEIGDPTTLLYAYQSLGNHLLRREAFSSSIKLFEAALELVEKNSSTEAEIYDSLASSYVGLEEFLTAEQYLRKSMGIFSKDQRNLGDNYEWKIGRFETQAKTYLELENALLLDGDGGDALEVTEFRRSRTLIDILLAKTYPSGKIPQVNEELEIEELVELARRHHTRFIVYSLAPLFRGGKEAHIWVISPEDLKIAMPSLFEGFPKVPTFVHPQTISLEAIEEDFTHFPEVLQSYPFCRQQKEVDHGYIDPLKEVYTSSRGARGGFAERMQQRIAERLRGRLEKWYQSYIAPVERYLPEDPTQTVTIIPDSFLSQLPFAAFRDPKGQYLIEKHPVSIAPSIKVLQLLDELSAHRPPAAETALVVGNPKLDDPAFISLDIGEKEAAQVSTLLGVSSDKMLCGQEATVTNVCSKIEKAGTVFFACHGEGGSKPTADPYSLFEGRLRLAPTKEDVNGHLHAENISRLNLQADLVFLSACESGTGKLQYEGTMGPVWSFLAAGASSVVATYWKLPESELTFAIVKEFYTHLVEGKLNKAQALQKALLLGIQKKREHPDQWAAFYLSGLNNRRGASAPDNPAFDGESKTSS